MTIHFCKALISYTLKNKSVLLYKSRTPFSVSFFKYYSSKPKKSKPTTNLFDYLVNQHQFSEEAALKASSSVTRFRNQEISDSVLSFLRDSGFAQTQLENVVKMVPNLLSNDLEKIVKPKIKIFQELGFSPEDTAEIISHDPWILRCSADNALRPSILYLQRLLDSNASLSKLLKKCGFFLKHDLEKTMKLNIEFMKSCGICSSQILEHVFNFPRFFLLKPEIIQDNVKRIDEMGFDTKCKAFLPAIRAISSMSPKKWELKLKLFRSLGFTEDDILDAFRRVPQVFAISERKIKEVTQVLLSARNLDISFVINHPGLLICSIENRLKPRLGILEVLEKKILLRRKPSLSTICNISNKRFLDKFVIPYSNELGVGLCLDSESSLKTIHALLVENS